MSDFRKMFLLLALLVAVTGIVSAQVNPLTCVANAGVVPIARAEGVAEEVGQVIINCTGGTPTAAGIPITPVNVSVFLSQPVTSKRLSTSGTAVEAVLLIDEPLPGTQYLATGAPPFTGTVLAQGGGAYVPDASHPNMFFGNQVGVNAITWFNVPVDPPGTTRNRVVKLTNVRVNATGAAGSSLIPGSINMFISISGTSSLALANPQITVAFVQKGLSFSVTSGSFLQCLPGSYSNPPSIKFSENFGLAFRVRGNVTPQNDPTIIYNTESIFWGTLPDDISGYNSAGIATQPTQLRAAFANVPAGASLKVPCGPLTGTGTLQIQISAGFTCSSGMHTVALSGGAGVVTWDVIAASNLQEEISIPVTVVYPNTVDVGTATVNGTYAPLSAATDTSTPSTGLVPRFVETVDPKTLFTINKCKTNLLFPFVTNQAGFDTGIAISNTSSDPFGTTTQQGVCKLYFYGNTGGSGPAPGAQTTTSAVAPGTQLLMVLSAGGTHGLTATPGFQGYIIASCEFQYAHGFAFISTPSALGPGAAAEGYLALVMDEGIGNRTGSQSEVLAH